jgi:hypothetical protein
LDRPTPSGITEVDLPSRDGGVFTNTGSPELPIELESELDDATDDDDSGLCVSRFCGADMVEIVIRERIDRSSFILTQVYVS